MPTPIHQTQAALAEARIAAVEAAVGEIRDAIVTIARLEERHTETRAAIAQCTAAIQQHESAVGEMRLQLARIDGRLQPLEEQRGFVMRAVLCVAGAVGMALVGLVIRGGAGS